MHEHDQARPDSADAAPARPGGRGLPAGMALQRAVGNRAMGRVLQRMEVAEAVDSLEKSLAAGVMGADRQVVNTLTAFSANPSDFDKVAIEYQKKTQQPLLPHVEASPAAAAQVPPGFYPTISGEKYPEPK